MAGIAAGVTVRYGGGVAPAFWADAAAVRAATAGRGVQGRVVMMSLRDGALPSKQSLVTKGDCFAKCARNDMPKARLASLRQLQSATGEELSLRTLLPSVLRPHEVPVAQRSGREERLRESCENEFQYQLNPL